MRKILVFPITMLRFLRYQWLRGSDAFVGANVVAMRRLVRAGRVTIGSHTWGTPKVVTFMHDQTRLEIGDYGSLSAQATIYLGGRHPTDRVTTYAHRIVWGMEGAGEDGYPVPSPDSRIGSDVWLCPGAIVISGIDIGDGAIVGAGSVVTKDVPPYGIVAGNPARLIGYRHTEEQRAALMEIAWWDWPEEEVRAAVPLLSGVDIDAFIAYARERFPSGSQ